MALTDKLTAIADAIRGKTGGTGLLTLDQMATEISGIEAGGGDDKSGEMVSGTITEYSNQEITYLRRYAFAHCTNLVRVNLPSALTVTDYAFGPCVSLIEVNLPKAQSFGVRAFDNCTALKTITLPSATNLGSVVFRTCTGLERAVFPVLANLPETFYGCTSLRFCELGAASQIAAKAFNSCTNFNTLVIRASSVCSLGNVNAFDGTCFAASGAGGTVYVPSALISEYQAATNWSTLYAAGTCNFVAIEGSEYE